MSYNFFYDHIAHCGGGKHFQSRETFSKLGGPDLEI